MAFGGRQDRVVIHILGPGIHGDLASMDIFHTGIEDISVDTSHSKGINNKTRAHMLVQVNQ